MSHVSVQERGGGVAQVATKDTRVTESATAIAAGVERVKQVIEDLPEEWYQRYVPLHMVASRAGVER